MTTKNDSMILDPRDQMRKAVELAAKKVKKETKAETPGEQFLRIRQESDAKRNKLVKRGAKRLIKKKLIKPMTSYFSKK